MKQYTVVGFFRDNDQPWVGHVYAHDITEIAEAARADVRATNDLSVRATDDDDNYPASELVIIEAFEGHMHSCLQNDEVIRPE